MAELMISDAEGFVGDTNLKSAQIAIGPYLLVVALPIAKFVWLSVYTEETDSLRL